MELICSGSLLVLGVCAFSGVVVHIGLFDKSYSNVKIAIGQNISLEWLWTIVHLIGLTLYLWATKTAYSNRLKKRITGIDGLFITAFLGFSILHISCSYLHKQLPILDQTFNIYPVMNSDHMEVVQRRIEALGDWILLPFQLWVVAWSRCIRRGWNLRHMTIMMITSSSIFSLTIIHHTMSSYLLITCSVLCDIALYELYKLHYYRPNIRVFFYASLVSNVLFCTLKALQIVFFTSSFIASASCVILNVIFTLSTTTLFSNISIDVNQHKF